MAIIVTPGQFSRRSEFYHQLAQLVAAGIGLTRALEQLQKHPPERSFRKPIEQTLGYIQQGATFGEALQMGGRWLPDFDTALLHAGEKSGRLDACFRVLAVYYNERARLAKQIISQLVYPAFLIHFAVLVFFVVLPFAASQFNASPVWLLFRAVLVLSPLYLGTALLIYAGQSKHGERWRAIIESILHPIPILGTGRRYLALSRLTIALESLLSAGVNIVEAWPLAANASGSPALRRAVESWSPLLEVGQTPADILGNSQVFPDFFVTQYTTGEISGQLDETLKRLHTYFDEEGTRKLRTVSDLVPRIIYFVIVLFIAYSIIRFYANLYGPGSELDKVLKEMK